MFMLDRLESRQFLSAVLVDGTLTITGTDAGEKIYVERTGNRLRAAIDRRSLGLFELDQVKRIVIDARGGDDFVPPSYTLAIPMTILGGAGDDSLYDGDGADFIHGGPGDDDLNGYRGRDTLIGGNGDDRLSGGPGGDVMNGSIGDDVAVKDGRDTISQVESVGPPRWWAPIPGLPHPGLPDPLSVTFQEDNGSMTAILAVTFNDSGGRIQIESVRRSLGQIFIEIQSQRIMGDVGYAPAVRTTYYHVPLGQLAPGTYSVKIATTDNLFSVRKSLSVDG